MMKRVEKTADLSKLAYRPAEFAAVVGLSTRTLYKLWEAGKGPPVARIGRRNVILRESGELWLKSLESAS